jgi:DNA-binding transcriptional regulator YiaG
MQLVTQTAETMTKKLEHMNRPLTDEERQRAASIREGAMRDFPPKALEREGPLPGIPNRIEAARRRLGITRYEHGRTAHVPSTVVRAIEQGDDVPLSQFRAVAAALGLGIELVEQT